MKYVITDHNKFAIGSGCYHHDLANALSGQVIHAGHCEFINGRIKVSGESIGFRIKAKEEDTERLERFMSIKK